MTSPLPFAITHTIRTLIGAEVIASQKIATGHSATIHHITLKNEQALVLKYTENDDYSLESEGAQLQYFARHTALPVPKLYFSNSTMLLMDYITNIPPSAQHHSLLAQDLAALHSLTSPHAGFDHDCQIGNLHQPNNPTQNWPEFYAVHRLLAMASPAHKAQLIDDEDKKNIDQLAHNIGSYLPDIEQKSLLHGDLWHGNMLHQNASTTYIDPASYFGHAEVELAFLSFLNTVPEQWFAQYHDINPIEPEFFSLRRAIYQLYPILVHIRIYGRSYLPALKERLNNIP